MTTAHTSLVCKRTTASCKAAVSTFRRLSMSNAQCLIHGLTRAEHQGLAIREVFLYLFFNCNVLSPINIAFDWVRLHIQ